MFGNPAATKTVGTPDTDPIELLDESVPDADDLRNQLNTPVDDLEWSAELVDDVIKTLHL